MHSEEIPEVKIQHIVGFKFNNISYLDNDDSDGPYRFESSCLRK